MLIRKPMVVAIIVLMSVAGNAWAAGDIERGGDLTFDCIECHRMDGKGDFETPEIAGLKEDYILKQLRDFYSRKRDSMDDMMHVYTEERTDQDLQDLAAYWASVKAD
jgi:cytochrome c553